MVSCSRNEWPEQLRRAERLEPNITITSYMASHVRTASGKTHENQGTGGNHILKGHDRVKHEQESKQTAATVGQFRNQHSKNNHRARV